MPYQDKVTKDMSWSDIPTCKESGVDVEYLMLRGIFMPAGVTSEQVKYYVDVLNKVKSSLEGELGGGTVPGGAARVAVADNGNILINESLVFEYNSYTIKPEGKRLLANLAKAFARVLADPAVRENVDVILVQGHTDERGTTAYNRELSAKRANAVLNHMFETDRALEQSYGAYFASSAYSEFRPLNPAKTEAAYEQNRRIEISVVLKDASVRGVIDEYMRTVGASATGAGGRGAAPP